MVLAAAFRNSRMGSHAHAKSFVVGSKLRLTASPPCAGRRLTRRAPTTENLVDKGNAYSEHRSGGIRSGPAINRRNYAFTQDTAGPRVASLGGAATSDLLAGLPGVPDRDRPSAAWGLEAAHITNFCHKGDRSQKRHTAHGLVGLDHRRH
jgi:hypothetical protein